MGLPEEHTPRPNRANTERDARRNRRPSGLMFSTDALEERARSTIEQANAAEKTQKDASAAKRPHEPYIVTRPGGRTVISPKAKVELQKQADPREDSARKREKSKARSKSVTTYNPSHPSVLFHRLKQGLQQGISGRLNIAGFRKRLTDWLQSPVKYSKTPRRFARHARSGGTRLIRHRSGLIIPSESAPFMLSSSSDLMSDLLAENQRLRRLVDEIARTDPVELAKLRRCPI